MSFASEIAEATKLLERFNGALRGATGGGAGIGGGAGAPGGSAAAGGRGFMAGLGPAGLAAAGIGTALAGASMIGDAASSAAAFMTPAARAYAVTGSSQAFASSITNSVLGAIGGTALGGFALGATGVTDAMGTNQRAGQGVLSVVEDLARIGVKVPQQQIQRMFDINQEREGRVTEMRGRVEGIANSAAELRDAKPKGANDQAFDALVGIASRIELSLSMLVAYLPTWMRPGNG